PGDIRIAQDSNGEKPRFGLRLVFPSADPLGAWELHELDREELEAEAEEVCRLLYVAATRAEERLILSGTHRPRDLEPLEQPGGRDTPLRRLLPALVELGWDGEEGSVRLPVPALIGGASEGERAWEAEAAGRAAGAERASEASVGGAAG